MTGKYLLVRFSDRTCWKIPAAVIAGSRAHYFAENDAAKGDGEYNEVYKMEFETTLEDNGELISWAKNNMDWEDVVNVAELVDEVERACYEKEWCNCDCEIIKD